MCHQLGHVITLHTNLKLENWCRTHRIKILNMEIVSYMNSMNRQMYQIHIMIDNHIQMIHHHYSAGKLCETAKSHLVGEGIIKHSLLK